MKWISVKDKLPDETHCRYLVWHIYDGINVAYYHASQHGEKYITWVFVDATIPFDGAITHWAIIEEPQGVNND